MKVSTNSLSSGLNIYNLEGIFGELLYSQTGLK